MTFFYKPSFYRVRTFSTLLLTQKSTTKYRPRPISRMQIHLNISLILIPFLLSLTLVTSLAIPPRPLTSIPELLPSHQTSPASSRSISTLGDPNMAMVCSDWKALTFDCQGQYGYYCDRKGKLHYTTKHQVCDDLCICIDIKPKPMCIFTLVGGAQCAS